MESTNRSFAGLWGSFGSNCISRKKITDIISAAERHDDGCPEPASVVAFSERMRRRLPFSLSVSIDVGIRELYRRKEARFYGVGNIRVPYSLERALELGGVPSRRLG